MDLGLSSQRYHLNKPPTPQYPKDNYSKRQDTSTRTILLDKHSLSLDQNISNFSEKMKSDTNASANKSIYNKINALVPAPEMLSYTGHQLNVIVFLYF